MDRYLRLEDMKPVSPGGISFRQKVFYSFRADAIHQCVMRNDLESARRKGEVVATRVFHGVHSCVSITEEFFDSAATLGED